MEGAQELFPQPVMTFHRLSHAIFFIPSPLPRTDPRSVKPPRLFPHSLEHPSPTKRHVPSKPVHFCQANFPNIGKERQKYQKCKFPKSWSFDGFTSFLLGNIIEKIGQSCWKKAEMHISKFWNTRFGPKLVGKKHIEKIGQVSCLNPYQTLDLRPLDALEKSEPKQLRTKWWWNPWYNP